MKNLLLMLATLLAINALTAFAADDPAQTKREIAQHRAIAAAHEAAAKCMEAGTDEEVCNAELAKTCKGIAIGKFCGMKHTHEQQ
jgi:hypothetical protein